MGSRHDSPWILGSTPRTDRERRTVQAMVGIYCRGLHGGPDAPCPGCRELLSDDATCRLDCCPFGVEKSICANCPIPCYKPAMRARLREVMREAGPRMIVRHPILAFVHLLDGRRKPRSP